MSFKGDGLYKFLEAEERGKYFTVSVSNDILEFPGNLVKKYIFMSFHPNLLNLKVIMSCP